MRTRLIAVLAALVLVAAACGDPGASEEGIDWGRETGKPLDRSNQATGASSASPPLTEREPGCLATIDSLPEPELTKARRDPFLAMRDLTIPALPLPGHENADRGLTAFDTTIDEFFRSNPNVIAPEERRAVMESAGFVANANLEFEYGGDYYDLAVMQFRTVEGARQYYDVHLRRICRDAMNLRPIDSHPSGVIYRRNMSGDGGVPRAVLLVGNVELAVTLCTCSGAGELEALAGKWLATIVEHLTTPDPNAV